MSIANTIIDAFQPIKDVFIPPKNEPKQLPDNKKIVYPEKIEYYDPAASVPVPIFDKQEDSNGVACYSINFPTQDGSLKLIEYCTNPEPTGELVTPIPPNIEFNDPQDYPIDGWFDLLKTTNLNWVLWYFADSISWNFSSNDYLDSGNFSANGSFSLNKYNYQSGNKIFWGVDPNFSYSETENSTYNIYSPYLYVSTYSKNYQTSVKGAGYPGDPISFDSGHYRVYRVDNYNQIGSLDSPIEMLSGSATSTIDGITNTVPIQETIAHLGQPMILYSVSKNNLKKHITRFKKSETTTNENGYRTTKWRLLIAPIYFGSEIGFDIDPVGDNPSPPNLSPPKGEEKENCCCCKSKK